MEKISKILALEKSLLKVDKLCESIDFIQIRIASPERIKDWARRTINGKEISGKIDAADLFDFKTSIPILDGLFCEKIFGPIKNNTCACLENTGDAINKICINCSVELIDSRVRRYRMGYIELLSPVSHIWYLEGSPSYLLCILECFKDFYEYRGDVGMHEKNALSLENIRKLIYFEKNDIDEVEHPLHKIYNYLKLKCEIVKPSGIEVIKASLELLNINVEIFRAREIAANIVAESKIVDNIKPLNIVELISKNEKVFNRIRILESFAKTGTQLNWMILTILPVLPPGLRPVNELENGQLSITGLNSCYQSIVFQVRQILRNKEDNEKPIGENAWNKEDNEKPIDKNACSKKILQELVDSLIQKAKSLKETKLNNSGLKNLTEILEGKDGIFRFNILGKRVDYSGRTIIVPEPSLQINECGLPFSIAIELFKPFLLNGLLKNISSNKDTAEFILEKEQPYIWTLVSKLVNKYYIILNRAPTLHKYGMQAFRPFIVFDKAIHLHPLVCAGFNADFDGDQMAVHLPIFSISQIEASLLMKPSSNIISQATGNIILKPTQDIIIGNYYLTLMLKKKIILSSWFSSEEDALQNLLKKKIHLHSKILIRYSLIEMQVLISSGKLKILDLAEYIINFQSFKIYKIFKSKINFYLMTDSGILIARKKKNMNYKITDFFFETTTGRILFSLNLKYLLKN